MSILTIKMPLNKHTHNNSNNRTCCLLKKTIMRIRIIDVLLGTIVLLGLSLAPKAYNLNLPTRSLHTPPSTLRTKTSSALSQNKLSKVGVSFTNKFREHHRNAFSGDQYMEMESSYHNMEQKYSLDQGTFTFDTDTAHSTEEPTKKTNNKLMWIALAVIAAISQVFGSQKLSATGLLPTHTPGLDDKNVLFSAVSATLLRRQKTTGSRPLPSFLNLQFLSSVVVVFHLFQQADTIIKAATTFGSVFSAWYMTALTGFPLITKSVTSGLIGILGDTTAQYIEQRIKSKKEGMEPNIIRNFDRRRGLAVLGDGILVSGPLLHFAYDMLENIIPVSGPYASLAAMTQVLVDDFILDAFFVAVMFITTGIAEGYTKQIIPQFTKDFIPTLKAGWITSLMLMPIQFICFRFLPLNFRVLGMNILDIFWEAVICYMVHRRRRMMVHQTKIDEERIEENIYSHVAVGENEYQLVAAENGTQAALVL